MDQNNFTDFVDTGPGMLAGPGLRAPSGSRCGW